MRGDEGPALARARLLDDRVRPGPDDYLVPVLPGPRTRTAAAGPAPGTGRTPSARSSPDRLRDEPFDVVVLQRPQELDLLRGWTGRRAGRDSPPCTSSTTLRPGAVPRPRHPLADRDDIMLVHVTALQRADLGQRPGADDGDRARHRRIPGTGTPASCARLAAVVNEPVRRRRRRRHRLLLRLAADLPVDVFGMGVAALADRRRRCATACTTTCPQQLMHAELARRRVYLHPFRWTSLGLSLIEAMTSACRWWRSPTTAARGGAARRRVVSADPADPAGTGAALAGRPGRGPPSVGSGRVADTRCERYGIATVSRRLASTC